MYTRVQFIAPLSSFQNIYYVRDRFGRVWHTVGTSEKEARNNITKGEDCVTYTLYSPDKLGEGPPNFDFKNLLLDMLEQLGLQDTYEYEIVVGWNSYHVFKFMKQSSLLTSDLLLDINKYNAKKMRENTED